MVEEDTWEPRENLGNAEDLVKEFEEEYGEIERAKKRRNREENRKGELLGRYTAKMLYGWDDKRFNEEYWGRLERNWNKWKEKEEEKDKKGRIEEGYEEDEIGNMEDPYNKL